MSSLQLLFKGVAFSLSLISTTPFIALLLGIFIRNSLEIQLTESNAGLVVNRCLNLVEMFAAPAFLFFVFYVLVSIFAG